MSDTRILAALLLLVLSASAQKRQPNKPSEPSTPPTPTGEPAEEKFPPQAGIVPPPKPEAPKSPFEGRQPAVLPSVAEELSLAQPHVAIARVANPRAVREYRLEHGLQVSG